MREVQPSVPVVFMSGYGYDPAGSERLEPEAKLLEKPFAPETLLACVREALGGTAATTAST